ncbi:MAG: class I SAM-dependent methyltransferase [Bacteroidetes bacterium]|nr:class I SAM-dependent methyltransferase [Bacteroidota bacterium]
MDKVRSHFYSKVVDELIPDKNASILICGGGELDKNTFLELGFSNVTVSNLDERMHKDSYHPFNWSFENAENLSFEDESFDYTVIHAAIHHASSPHKVLTEMYRVASKGVLAFESRDSFVMRILEKWELTQVYEHAAVYYNDCKYGGVNNTEIPNFIYRWTEREVEKTIKSFSPGLKHEFAYRYGTAFPCTPEMEKNNSLKTIILKIARPFYFLFAKLFPRQQNLFAFFIKKPNAKTDFFPWLVYDEEKKNITFNKQWGDERYNANVFK